MPSLTELPLEALGAVFETALLSTLGSAAAHPVSTWSKAYRRLSAELTSGREDSLAASASAELGDQTTPALAGLIYASRTLQIARPLLDAYPPPPGRFVEVGAGWGPVGALAAARGAAPVELWDLIEEPLSRAPALFHSLGLAAPRLVRSDGRVLEGPVAGVAAAFSLNEMLARLPQDQRVAAGTKLVRGWLKTLVPGGRLYLLEPGLYETAQVLQQIRDAVAGEARVVGPCLRSGGCPIAGSPRDWCHFTLPIRLGEVGRAVANQAQRRHSEAHVSWLILEAAAPAPEDPALARVLDARERRQRRIELTTCSASGYEDLVVLARTPELKSLERVRSNAVVRLERSKLIPKGDGLRVEDPASVQLLRDA